MAEKYTLMDFLLPKFYQMKIIILIEKYGGFCNRLFQSLHYHAYSMDKGIKF